MRIAICDDDPQSLEKIQTVLAAHEGQAVESHLYESGEALLTAITDDGLRFDALFIDMEMTGLNGIETVSALRDLGDDVTVVFVTSHNKYMKESFQCRPLRFVEKSRLDIELPEAIEAATKECARKQLSLAFSDNKTDVHLYYEEIYYIESHAHYLELHTKTAVYRTRSTFAEFEPTLQPGIFARVHRGFLVNLEHVRSVSAGSVTLRDDAATTLSLGEKYKDSFRTAWHHYLERKAGL